MNEETKKRVKPNKLGSHNSGVVRNKYGTGIRSFLVNSGLDNSKIDYDSKNNSVTYNGKAVIQPNSVIDGTSYADESSLRGLALDLAKEDGRELVSAADYASKKTGLSNAVSVNDGYISIGDDIVKSVVSSGNDAYIDKNVLEGMVSEYMQNNNVKSENELWDTWYNEQGTKIENAIYDFLNEDWEYNPEDDPAYQAYSDMYIREGERAFQNAFGNAISNTGGYTSSAAASAAAQGMNYYMQQLGDRIPELAAADFERFQGKREQRLEAINNLINFSEKSFENSYKANSDYINRINQANDTLYNQKFNQTKWESEKSLNDSREYMNYIEAALSLLDIEYTPDLYDIKIDENLDKQAYKQQQYAKDLERQEIEAKNQLAMQHAELVRTISGNLWVRGYYTDEEADILGLAEDDSRRESQQKEKEEASKNWWRR